MCSWGDRAAVEEFAEGQRPIKWSKKALQVCPDGGKEVEKKNIQFHEVRTKGWIQAGRPSASRRASKN